MIILHTNTQPTTVTNDRFKVVIDHKQVRVIDEVAKETTVIDAKAFKAPGSPDTLPFEWLPDTFDQAFKEDLIENNRLGLKKMQVAGSLASWVRKGMLIHNEDNTKTKSNSESL